MDIKMVNFDSTEEMPEGIDVDLMVSNAEEVLKEFRINTDTVEIQLDYDEEFNPYCAYYMPKTDDKLVIITPTILYDTLESEFIYESRSPMGMALTMLAVAISHDDAHDFAEAFHYLLGKLANPQNTQSPNLWIPLCELIASEILQRQFERYGWLWIPELNAFIAKAIAEQD